MKIANFKKIFTSFRSRLFMSVAILNAVLVSVFISDFLSREQEMFFDRELNNAKEIARALAATSAEEIAANDIISLEEIVAAYTKIEEINYIIITDKQGKILAHTDRSKIGKYLLNLPKNIKQNSLSNSSLIDITCPVNIANNHLGWVRIGINENEDYIKQIDITKDIKLYGFLVVLIGSIIVWLLSRYITKRLYAIQKTINEIRSGNASARTHINGTDEAATLAKEFNALLDAKEIYEIELKEIIKNLEDYKFALDQSAITAITDKNGIILSVNDNFCKISKYSREELIGKTHHIINSNSHPIKFFRDMWDTITSGKVWIGEVKNKTKNGDFYWVHGTIVPFLDNNGKPFQYLSIRFDITERIYAEEEMLKAKERAEESDRLKSSFLANMSHEIRTPMNGILGFAELLKGTGISGEDRKDYIQIIEKSGVRMLNIINDIVDISKIESGLMEISLVETNINTQIEYIYNFFKPEVLSKGIDFSYKTFLPTNKSTLKTDREKVYAVLINLVKNAIKYTDVGSIEFGYTVKSNTIEFYVKDTGIGIPKNKLEAVFNRFIQVDISQKRAVQGAGLGLSISKSYVEMLGGTIWIESEEGKGSTFYFTIPYKVINENNTPKKLPIKNENTNKIKNLKILIVEDDAISKLLISKFVSAYSNNILKASTGFEAIEICLNNPDIDLVLMDVNMPEMNGLDATKQIRQFNKEVIIIAQTAYGLSNDKEEAIAVGCNDYISKPINIDELKGLIRKYFN